MYLILILIFFLYWLARPAFGQRPKNERLAKIKKLPNYKDGALRNLSPTPDLQEGVTYFTILRKMFKRNKNGAPAKKLPHVNPDFSRSDALKITWFGHSSYLIQVDQLNILVDPVFGNRPSPFRFIGTKNFDGTNFLTVEELPELDIVLITHDHYDHLDYPSILKLKDKTKLFLTSLGVGAHLEAWNISPQLIKEMVWEEQLTLLDTLTFTALPARHFTGRTLKRNQTLWSSFVLKTVQYKIYMGGDSGYDTHFKTIGDQHGPFDLAILECGQYNHMWPYIHMLPPEVFQAYKDLNAKVLLPVHWSKFKLALHDWDEPVEELLKVAGEEQDHILTPSLGESFKLNEPLPLHRWWRNY